MAMKPTRIKPQLKNLDDLFGTDSDMDANAHGKLKIQEIEVSKLTAF